MTIGSLPMALSEIIAEFVGTSAMSAYLRGGTYVPPLTANAGIATSLPLTMSSFVGASVATDMDASYYAESVGIKGGSSTCTLYVYPDGIIAGFPAPSSVATFSDTWVSATADPGAWYQVYVSVTAGSTPSGTLNTWLDLSSVRSWTLSSSANCTLSVKIRHKYNTASEETTSVQLLAGS